MVGAALKSETTAAAEFKGKFNIQCRQILLLVYIRAHYLLTEFVAMRSNPAISMDWRHLWLLHRVPAAFHLNRQIFAKNRSYSPPVSAAEFQNFSQNIAKTINFR